MTGTFTDNAEKNRFEYHIGGTFAFADYRREGAKLYIDKVEAPPELRGTGAAGKLMQHIADAAKERNLRIVPICSYAVAWMRKNSGHEPPQPG